MGKKLQFLTFEGNTVVLKFLGMKKHNVVHAFAFPKPNQEPLASESPSFLDKTVRKIWVYNFSLIFHFEG